MTVTLYRYISIIFGFVVGCLIMKNWVPNIYSKGPDSHDIKENIYMTDNYCYQFVPHVYICPIGTNKK